MHEGAPVAHGRRGGALRGGDAHIIRRHEAHDEHRTDHRAEAAPQPHGAPVGVDGRERPDQKGRARDADPDARKMHVGEVRRADAGEAAEHQRRRQHQHVGTGETAYEAQDGKRQRRGAERHGRGRKSAQGEERQQRPPRMPLSPGQRRAQGAGEIAREVGRRDQPGLALGEL